MQFGEFFTENLPVCYTTSYHFGQYLIVKVTPKKMMLREIAKVKFCRSVNLP